MRILLIEDDELLVNLLLDSLKGQHYVVDVANDGKWGWEYAQSADYELLLIDVGLPKLDGITLCQRLREAGCTTPILLMTARDDSNQRIRGLDAGADDYLSKPLDLGELHARLRALVRRGEVVPTTVLEMGKLRLDPSRGEATYQEQLLKLTPKEYMLLELFLRNPTRLFSRGQIIEHLWSFDDPPQEESVKAHIKGLRQKLKRAGAPDCIENVYGMGYRLKTEPPESKAAHKVTQALEQLWQQHQELMVQRLDILQGAVTSLQSGSLSEPERSAAKLAAHKLAGVLGTFGKEEGTVIAREIENLLEPETQITYIAQKLPYLVQQLSQILNLKPTAAPLVPADGAATSPPAKLLLIAADSDLAVSLQQLTQSEQVIWQALETPEQAQIWLKDNSIDLAVLNLEKHEHWSAGLALIAQLTAQTPAIPCLVLTGTDRLESRVALARAGAQIILLQPVSTAEIWQGATKLLQHRLQQSVKVLVVDDDPLLLASLPPLLEPWGIHLTALANPLDFWQVLARTEPDLLILDVEMPQLSGIDLCQAVRTSPEWQGLPILFLTAHRDRDTIQKVFAAGADDYITKPVVAPELLIRITNRLERHRLWQTLATKEPITGLSNQPQSWRKLEELLQGAEPFSFTLMAVENLSSINFHYGHPAGHRLLQHWGGLLRAQFPAPHILSYWGNGEFIIVGPGLGQGEASAVMQDVLLLLRRQIFVAPDGDRFQAHFSWGMVGYPQGGKTVQALYQAARQELQTASG